MLWKKEQLHKYVLSKSNTFCLRKLCHTLYMFLWLWHLSRYFFLSFFLPHCTGWRPLLHLLSICKHNRASTLYVTGLLLLSPCPFRLAFSRFFIATFQFLCGKTWHEFLSKLMPNMNTSEFFSEYKHQKSRSPRTPIWPDSYEVSSNHYNKVDIFSKVICRTKLSEASGLKYSPPGQWRTRPKVDPVRVKGAFTNALSLKKKCFLVLLYAYWNYKKVSLIFYKLAIC